MKKKNKAYKLFLVTLLVSVVSLSAVVSTFAATTGTVTATVTAQNVSISVTDGSVAYGTLSLSDNEDTTTAGINDSQTATNNGNITEDFNILGQNSGSWTLVATAGSDQYTHKWCVTDCDGSPTWNAISTGYTTLATGIAGSGGTQVFDLQIGTPTSSSVFTQQSVDVTVQAVAN
jgi:uncharacterized cupredoxin-like copper-binding protein